MVRYETESWLHIWTLFFSQYAAMSFLMMRPRADTYTPDDVLKRRWYEAMTDFDRQRLVMTFDDRDRMVRLWRDLGVSCMQVAYGDF
jgi:hypothetical protein